MSRKKTDSITHLVKIVAEEVFEEKTSGLISQIKDALYNRTGENQKEELTKIVNSLDYAGESWSRQEQSMLEKELEFAFSKIAANHGRTPFAIACKASTNGLLHSSKYKSTR